MLKSDTVPDDVREEFGKSLDADIEKWQAAVEKHVRQYEQEHPADA